ncbi:flagellar hook-length control protein FliK [Jeongeupia naejangsanensis]|uniref:Flagellar hook-length control protein FliK n=1 Tax=Jeongeupia naejangsanensis TaxID=613195 RepID=A0ABS2BF28_9NEIS|nr:flagellar hook-length control protein FliK [Jeongeupia naejangsanensis]MBM3114212.1 flagellar hook-length control protein FliK [Jeongeupia naejangsanensis]
MLPGTNAVGLLQQYLQGQTPLIDTARLAGTEEVLLTVGERLQAIVRNELPNGRFAVQIKDQLLDLNLPRNTQPGEQVELEVVSTSPALRFALLQGNAAEPRQATTLSTAARALAELLRPTAGTGAKGVDDPEPLLKPSDGAEPDVPKLTERLAQAINNSGLFYESHQADWVRGERPLQALMREPQNAPAADTARAGAGLQAEGSGGAASRVDETRTVLGQLVQRQLNALDQGGVVWQGQAWPGQPLRWALNTEVPDESRHATVNDEQTAQRWQTRLDLTLPRLGSVSVLAELHQGQFSLRFISPETETRAAISAGQPVLQARFAAAGLALAGTPAVVASGDGGGA